MTKELKALWVLWQTENVDGELAQFKKTLGIVKTSEFLLGYSQGPTEINSDFSKLSRVFSDSLYLSSLQEIQNFVSSSDTLAIKLLKPGVQDPQIVSLKTLMGEVSESTFVRIQVLELNTIPKDESLIRNLRLVWCEPAIETLEILQTAHFGDYFKNPKKLNRPADNSAQVDLTPQNLDLEFSHEEINAISQFEQRRGSTLTRTEWEVLAQSWSEHCKHKIFGAKIIGADLPGGQIDGLFKQFIRKPSWDQIEKDQQAGKARALSVFVDNAGVLRLFASDGTPTPWAYCLKMETHNSPSALSPRGGAATGLVGVHRDILGTGRLARPIANWDVLCFESSEHCEPRPPTALSPKIIRSGVLRGIEEGGNQSGIPTVMGSVVFDPRFSVKPYVFAGSVGLLPLEHVNKRPQPGMKLFVVGGATGADGLRGAVMSSRDLRTEDFVGSAVQVAQPFVQRRMTDFLLAAATMDLIDVITDNGAGGLSSSVGEMATLTGGATIDLSNLRLKFEGLHGWEKLLSESQERMTLATARPEELKKLAGEWAQDFDEIGELNSSGNLLVSEGGKILVNLNLRFLHEGCPRLNLQTDWDFQKEKNSLNALAPRGNQNLQGSFEEKFVEFLKTETLCSREGVARRFDHEVGGRNLKKFFCGTHQNSPTDGALIEIPESPQPAAISLGHGLAPQYSNIFQNTVHSFDEALRTLVLSGGDMGTAGLLDNYAWPDPTHHDQRIWRLAKSVECVSILAQEFEIPFVSGKDSLKNNSKEFFCPETVVVSVGASVKSLGALPVSHFSQSNDVVFCLPPLMPTLFESAWHREGGISQNKFDSNPWNEFCAPSVVIEKQLRALAQRLKLRYQKISNVLQNGLVKAAKDISDGGLAVSIFEMGLGEKLGFFWEKNFEELSEKEIFSEGLGGFVLCVDPHCVSNLVTELGPEILRLGVVMRPFEWRWGRSAHFMNLENSKKAYLQKTVEGFWQ